MDDNSGNDPNHAYQALSGGWMMGLGAGVLAMFLAAELPYEFYHRARIALAAIGLATLVWGVMRCRLSGVFAGLTTEGR